MGKVLEGCCVCGAKAPTMLVRNYEAICFECFAEKYPQEIVQLRDYLKMARDKTKTKSK